MKKFPALNSTSSRFERNYRRGDGGRVEASQGKGMAQGGPLGRKLWEHDRDNRYASGCPPSLSSQRSIAQS
jgi:hypothetical protein